METSRCPADKCRISRDEFLPAFHWRQAIAPFIPDFMLVVFHSKLSQVKNANEFESDLIATIVGVIGLAGSSEALRCGQRRSRFAGVKYDDPLFGQAPAIAVSILRDNMELE